jgi:hypothetical protein
MSLLEALWCDSARMRLPGGLVVAGGAVVVGAALVEGPVLVAGAAVESLARWLPAQAAKASTAAMAKAASPPIRGVCLVLRDPPVVASAPDLLSTVDLLPPALADRLLESGTNQLGRLAHIGENLRSQGI